MEIDYIQKIYIKMNKINLEEILLKNIKKIYMEFMPIEDFCNRDKIIAINAMKEACQEILRLAAENATLSYADGRYCLPDYAVENFNAVVDDLDNAHFIDKQSILDTINQIE